MESNYKIYAVDFDQTLAFGSYPIAEKPNVMLMHKLTGLQKEGNKIILWTCRNGKPLEDAIKLCLDCGLEFDAVNENLPEILAMYDNKDSRKITADYYIDDKAIGIDLTHVN